jgi:hypothetical protein
LQTGSPLPDGEAKRLLALLTQPDRAEADRALEEILRRGDGRFVAVLAELLRGSELGLVAGGGHNARVVAMERLSGQHFGADWVSWAEWVGASGLGTPPGFAEFKVQLFARIDPRYGEILAREWVRTELLEEIHWSGVLPGGIPALVDPPVMAAEAATHLTPFEPVIGLRVAGESRAYPLRILDWHEVVNDVVGGRSICVVACPLCGSGLAYDAQAGDGERRRFEVSGLVLRSVPLLTESVSGRLWNPVRGEALTGEAARLEPLPAVISAWQSWREQHPDTSVISLETGHLRPYAPGQPYADYFSSDRLLFPVPGRSGPLADKDRVYGVREGDAAVAFPLEQLVERGVTNDAVGATPLVLVATRGAIRARIRDLREEGFDYDVGAEVRAYLRGAHQFRPGFLPDELLDEGGATWRVAEDALLGPDGERARRVPGLLAYWFVWHAFFPEAAFRGDEAPERRTAAISSGLSHPAGRVPDFEEVIP